MPRFAMRKSQPANSLLLIAIGAAAGVVAGAVLVDRFGGLDKLLKRGSRSSGTDGGTPQLEEPYGLHDADGGYDDDDYDGDYEDDEILDGADEELSPESISHLHAGGRQGRSRSSARAYAAPDVLTLEARVLEAFHNDPVLRERAIDIGAIAEGVIELTGWVHADSEVAHAVTIAGGVPDVFHVVDQLTVRQPARSRRATDPRPVLPQPDPMSSAAPPRAD